MVLRWVHADEPVDPKFVEFVVESFPELDPASLREELNREWIEVDEPDDVPAPMVVPENFELAELAFGERRNWAERGLIAEADLMDVDDEGWEL